MKFISTILFAIVVGLFIMWLVSEIATMEGERPRVMEERANPPN